MHFVKESLIHATPERVFAFHEQDNALELLSPPWETARVIQHASISQIGSQAIIEASIVGPIKTRWIAEHTVYQPPHLFEDVQLKGPFQSWRHRHIIAAHPEGAVLRDEIAYEPPLGIIGRILAPLLIERRLSKLFEYRHEVTREWCEAKISPMSKVQCSISEGAFKLDSSKGRGPWALDLGRWTLALELWTGKVPPWIQNACLPTL